MDLSSAIPSRHGPRACPGGTLSSSSTTRGHMTRCPGASSSRLVRGTASVWMCAQTHWAEQPQATCPPGGRVVSPRPLGSAHKCSTAVK